jgi:peptidyl-dipeptidase Dcp
MTYQVFDENGKFISLFYADFFPRPSKRQGAWMTSFRGQYNRNGKVQHPIISIVCNFTKPTETKPSLLSFDEVTTLFHEFGHALHGICADGKYESLSGTNVYWDFVELPSQVLENWCYEKECLDFFAKHYQTGETIPQDLIDKIKKSASFNAGMQTVRQIGLSLLDMNWHTENSLGVRSVKEFEDTVCKKTDLLETIPTSTTSCSFSHIFNGGYSSGYYSYKWAEVLDADAFEYFKEKGIFNKEIANKFKTNVLSAGGSEDPMTLYKRFRGQEPDVKALLRRSGLV